MIKAILIVIISALLSFLTSALLSIDWIQEEWSRKVLVYFFMLVELVVGFFSLRAFLKSNV